MASHQSGSGTIWSSVSDHFAARRRYPHRAAAVEDQVRRPGARQGRSRRQPGHFDEPHRGKIAAQRGHFTPRIVDPRTKWDQDLDRRGGALRRQRIEDAPQIRSPTKC